MKFAKLFDLEDGSQVLYIAKATPDFKSKDDKKQTNYSIEIITEIDSLEIKATITLEENDEISEASQKKYLAAIYINDAISFREKVIANYLT